MVPKRAPKNLRRLSGGRYKNNQHQGLFRYLFVAFEKDHSSNINSTNRF